MIEVNKQEIIKRIGRNIKVERAKNDMRQKELRIAIGIKQSNLSAYENGLNTLNVIDLIRIVKGLDCAFTDIIDDEIMTTMVSRKT